MTGRTFPAVEEEGCEYGGLHGKISGTVLVVLIPLYFSGEMILYNGKLSRSGF